MRSELLSQEKNVVTIKVIIDKADFAKQLKSTYNQIARGVNIPGFRKGKAPKAVLDMRFGKATILGQALEEMMPDTLDAVCRDYELELISTPDVDLEELAEGKDVVFTAKFEVEPAVELPELSGITVDRPAFEVTDAMVDESLDSLKKRFATFKGVKRAAKLGDQVRAAYSMSVKDDDGKEIVSHEPQIETFLLDNMAMRPEIVSALNGAEAGDKKTASIVVDPSYQDKSVADKKADYEFDVVEVLEPVDPEMNDEFFKKVTSADVHSEEELREDIRKHITERLENDARNAAENDAVAKIAEGTKVDIPESMLKRQKDHLRTGFEENIKKRTGKTLEEYYKDENQSMEEFEENLEKDARRDVLGYLVVDACAKKFGVSVEREDIDAEIATMAANYGIAAESIKEMLQKNPDDFRNIISTARYRKAMKAIMDTVKVQDVKVDTEASSEDK